MKTKKILLFIFVFILFSELTAQKYSTSFYVSPVYAGAFSKFYLKKSNNYGVLLGAGKSIKYKKIEFGLNVEFLYSRVAFSSKARRHIIFDIWGTEQFQSVYKLDIPIFMQISLSSNNKRNIYLQPTIGLSSVIYSNIEIFETSINKRKNPIKPSFFSENNFIDKKIYLFTEFIFGIYLKKIKIFIEPSFRLFFTDYKYTVNNFNIDGIATYPETFTKNQNLLLLKLGYKF